MKVFTRCAAVPDRLCLDMPSRRILVVDDDRDNAESLALLLRVCGHETEAAYDGAEAVHAAREMRPDVALLDFEMPEMDGPGVAWTLRSEPWAAHLKLIAISGWHRAEDFRRAAEAGFDAYLLKPVHFGRLQELLLRDD